MNAIGIRREDKNEWERRVPLTPDDVARLVRDGVRIRVQPSPRRVFEDAAYAAAGAEVDEDLGPCSLVLGVKEMPLSVFREGQGYVFFSHTVKGQSYNMPMLRRMMEKRAHLIDYERIVDEEGRRLVMFGRFAGLAGMIDTLWTFGRRLAVEGHMTGFADLKPTHEYPDLRSAKDAVRAAGERVAREGWPAELGPVVCGFAGYGNVSEGAQEIYRELSPREITPEELLAATPEVDPTNPFVKVVFHEKHMVERIRGAAAFDLQEYYRHPDRFRGTFDRYLPHFTILVNAIYWDERYPRLLTLDTLRQGWRKELSGLKVIGDITCDIGGAIECTVKATDPGNPVYVYQPATETVRDGFEGDGPVILAVDILPCELPREASQNFSEKLTPYVPQLAAADFTRNLSEVELPGPIRAATILWKGQLAPDYEFMSMFLD
jgi:alpha-aminoadipic semialdehyde synthase